MVDSAYKDFDCVKNLGKYKECFLKIADYYGEELSDKLIIDGNVYTFHNFNNHCMDLFKIISQVLLEKDQAYNTEGGLSDKELYLLNLAVLFHDISMSQNIMVERSNHSLYSADYVQELYDDVHSLLYKEGGLNKNEIKALKAIITAHSNVKDGTIAPELQGMNTKGLNDEMPAKEGTVRGKLLAGILRIADELDITSARLGNSNIEDELVRVKNAYLEMELKIQNGEGEGLEAKYQEYGKYVESLAHWKKLHLFEDVKRKNQDDTIYLVTDDEHLQQLLDGGNTAPALARDILEGYEKIQKEWTSIKKIIVDDSGEKLNRKRIFPAENIEIQCSIQEIQKELNKLKNASLGKFVESNSIASKDESKDSNNQQQKTSNKEGKVELVDIKLAQELEKEINKRHLLKVGHFLLDADYCARDWIDIKEIVETGTIADEIVKCFVNHIKGNYNHSKKYLLVGLDIEGALLASKVAMELKMPFSYIIPVKEKNSSSVMESGISVKEYDSLILITDAIVTYDTIRRALDEIKSEKQNIYDCELLDKVEWIYSIFYRESAIEIAKNNDCLKEKTFCGNKGFPIEVFKKECCQYNKSKRCFALNARMKGETI